MEVAAESLVTGQAPGVFGALGGILLFVVIRQLFTVLRRRREAAAPDKRLRSTVAAHISICHEVISYLPEQPAQRLRVSTRLLQLVIHG